LNNFNHIPSDGFEQIKFPSHKNENWRYVNLRDLKKILNKSQSTIEKHNILKDQNIESDLIINDEAIHVKKIISNEVSIDVISPDQIKNVNPSIKDKIGNIAKIDDFFVSDNTSSFNKLILIGLDGKLDFNINIDINISKDVNFKNRFFIYSASESSSSIQINFHNRKSIVNSLFEFFIQDSSNLKLICVNNGKESVDIINYWFEIHKNANLNATFISLGSEKILKNDIRVDLIGKSAKADIGGLYIPQLNALVDYNLKINHLSKKTSSKQFFRGILGEYSRASFTGLVKIEEGCSESKSEQANNNLLLSDKAFIKSDPQLEIYCDEVECSHGSTIGQFDDDTLFYLCSRGIPKQHAQKLLLEAFYIDILNRINSPKIKSMVENNLV
tara:strand:+ start:10052 stop:11212 length:1161 start_codon:yes stop_codon:yes gene_type:complete